jgi:hypothetical protein
MSVAVDSSEQRTKRFYLPNGLGCVPPGTSQPTGPASPEEMLATSGRTVKCVGQAGGDPDPDRDRFEAWWGQRKNNLLRSQDALFYGYYLSAAIMRHDESGPASKMPSPPSGSR